MTDPIVVLSLVVRRGDIDRAAFRDHYETTHAPLAIPIIGPDHYVRHHLSADIDGSIDFDVVTEFRYDDLDRAMAASSAAANSDALRADELTFMDVDAMRAVSVREVSRHGEPASSSLWVLINRGSAEPVDLDALMASSSFAIRRDAMAWDEDPAFDISLQLAPDTDLTALDPVRDAGHTIRVFSSEAYVTH